MFFQVGLLMALGFAFVAFEWQTAPRVSDVQWDRFSTIDVTDIYIPPTRTPEAPPPPAPPQPTFDLELVDDDIFIDSDPIIINVERGENPIASGLFEEVKIVEVDEPTIFDPSLVEFPPMFNGKTAETGFREYIRNNLNYPQLAIENRVSGTVFVQFIVDQNGQVVDVKVVRSADPALDQEATRLIMASPTWTPGKQYGKAVKVRFTFPITFRLQ